MKTATSGYHFLLAMIGYKCLQNVSESLVEQRRGTHTRQGLGCHLQIACYVYKRSTQNHLRHKFTHLLISVLCCLKAHEVGMHLRLYEALFQYLAVENLYIDVVQGYTLKLGFGQSIYYGGSSASTCKRVGSSLNRLSIHITIVWS